LVAACISLAIGVGMFAKPGAAQPSIGTHSGIVYAEVPSLAEKVHGFHCRSVFGWDPVAGAYRHHKHAGICANYKRCLREQKRCVFVLGRRRDPWSYEAFGSDNVRFTRCMIRAGCY
jgi:hypothetical protein